ncbi:4Fe-4S binding protein [Candidatus Woesearchaeota archaeon]|jgi:pyruvate ferredoxin oxidoreductase delta subunit|nr:4Fe-4S binding protein [Candidatus Woesearchaeota archaeon]
MPKKKQAKAKLKTPKTKKLDIGAVITTPGNSDDNKTGGWRALRPVWNRKKCTQCMICWPYCPDMAIPQKDGKRLETDFDFCKGCGICKQVCPFAAITMEKEKK